MEQKWIYDSLGLNKGVAKMGNFAVVKRQNHNENIVDIL